MTSTITRSQPWSAEAVEALTTRHKHRKGALLPILHDVQHAFGYIPAEAVPIIAGILNMSRAEVYGAISFYHDFKEEAPGTKPVIKLCRAEACQARGVAQIAPLLAKDGRVEIETVYCLGLCASGPAAMIGEKVFARLDKMTIGKLVEEAVS